MSIEQLDIRIAYLEKWVKHHDSNEIDAGERLRKFREELDSPYRCELDRLDHFSHTVQPIQSGEFTPKGGN